MNKIKTTKLSQLQREILAWAYVNHVSEQHARFDRCPHPDLYPAEVLVKHYGLQAKIRIPSADPTRGSQRYMQAWLDSNGIGDAKPEGFYWSETIRIKSNTWIADGNTYHGIQPTKEPVGFYWREWDRRVALAFYGYVWGWGAPVFDTDDPAYSKAHAGLSRTTKRLAERGLIVTDRIRTVDVTGLWLTPAGLAFMAAELETVK